MRRACGGWLAPPVRRIEPCRIATEPIERSLLPRYAASMEYLFLLIPALVFLLAYVLRGDGGFKQPEVSPLPGEQLSMFEAAPSLFVNAAEAALFLALRQNLPRQFHVHSKVRLEDIIRVKRGVEPKLKWAMRGRVKSRHVDYLIATANGRSVMAIELDGASHNPKNPSEADKVKTALFGAAGLPLRRIRVGEDFNMVASQIAAEINQDRYP